MAGASEGRSLEQTPTWALATVCFVLIAISIVVERSLHKIEQWFVKKHNRALFEALEKIKSGNGYDKNGTKSEQTGQNRAQNGKREKINRRKKSKRIEEEQAAKAQNWKLPVCYDDDDDEERSISLKDNIIYGLPPCAAITPSLPIKEPDNSLSMRDEHLDTISATESDEFIKSSVESLVSIPSESEGIPDNMCDVPFHDNSRPLDISKDQFEDFYNSNDESTLTDDDSFSIDNIEYVESSPPNSELVSSEAMEIVIPEVGGIDDDILLTIKDDILREKFLPPILLTLSEETNTFDNSLAEFETFCFDLEEISSGSTTTRFDITLPEYEAFYVNHVKEISSGGVISPEYDCFFFKIEPNWGDFTMDVVEDISPTREPRVHVYNTLPTHPTLHQNLEFILSSESLFTYVVWIFLPFLSYSVAPQYLLSFGNEDTIFDPGICSYHFFSFRPDVSHRCGTFTKFKVLNESPMEISISTCSPMDK
nr:MLO-like protein 6 [Tanacetum cinerariifolium]